MVAHSPHRVVIGAMAAWSILALGSVISAPQALPAPTGAPPPASPALEPFSVEKVIQFQLPSGVTANTADLSPDAQHLLVEVVVDGKTQVASTNLDGADYQCISCGTATNATKVLALEDSKRIWYADTSGQQSTDDPGSGGTGSINYSLLECSPSIYDCRQKSNTKVKFPSDKRNLPAQNREAKPDPFGEYVTWNEVSAIEGTRMSIAKLAKTDKGYELTDQRVFSPPWVKKSDFAADRENAMRFYEGASWHEGGRILKYQETSTGLNYDIYLLDTATGERRQLTTDLDYNEAADIAPDGRTVYFTSARGLDRMDVFTALQRPSLIDSGAFGQIARVSLWNNRRCMNEPWMMQMDPGQQLGGYSGQPIIIDPAWTVRGWSWFPDSTRAVINEQERPADSQGPGAPDTPWRTSIVRFSTRNATAPMSPVHQNPAAIAKWSVPIKDFNPMMGRQAPLKVLKGKKSGTATIQYLGAYAIGSYAVAYKNYSDDGKTFIDGTERIVVPYAAASAEWSADLTSKGERSGYLKGNITIGAQNKYSGEVTSEINGKRYSGIPTQGDCPSPGMPALAVSASDGGVQVTATVSEDANPRPVRGAKVTAGSASATTDDRGFASIAVPAGTTVNAQADGFKATSTEVAGS